jgi:2-polyprenyl-3-methyl-5-hydroxy-6-metoxy-1,4-benzoquinol methylase
MTDALVNEFYTRQVDGEWRRLVKDVYHRLEFATTLHFLEKYFPKHGLILDAGGGPGRYSLELARMGYEVVLLDAAQANLDFAQRQVKRTHMSGKVRDIRLGNIADLSVFADDLFDGVICTGGPLSHILDPQQREKAITELTRVTKPGSPLFVSVMGRLAVLVVILLESPAEMHEPRFHLLRETGDYLGGYGFTACHFFLPEELKSNFTRDGLQILELAGLEGISSSHVKALNKLAKDETGFRIWLETHYQTCTHPAVVGMSEHMLIVCRKLVPNQ